jgi:hypothetical protein
MRTLYTVETNSVEMRINPIEKRGKSFIMILEQMFYILYHSIEEFVKGEFAGRY